MTKKWRKSILKKKSNLIQGKNGESRRSTVIRSTAEMEWKIKEKKKNFPQLTDLQILWMHDQWPMTGLSIHIHPVQLFSLFFIQFFFFWTVSYLVQLICDWNWTICINFDVKQLKFAQICTIWMWKSKFLTNLDIKNQILIHFDLKQQKFGQICTFFTLKLRNLDIKNKNCDKFWPFSLKNWQISTLEPIFRPILTWNSQIIDKFPLVAAQNWKTLPRNTKKWTNFDKFWPLKIHLWIHTWHSPTCPWEQQPSGKEAAVWLPINKSIMRLSTSLGTALKANQTRHTVGPDHLLFRPIAALPARTWDQPQRKKNPQNFRIP